MDSALNSGGALAALDPWWVAAGLAMLVVVMAFSLWRQRRPSSRAEPGVDESAESDGGVPGLLSRGAFDDALDKAVLAADRGGSRWCVLFIGLDNLSSINDAFGHACGDRAIRRAAHALVALAAPSASLTRVGGDAFALLAELTLDDARDLAAKLVRRISAPDHDSTIEPTLSCSIGIACYPAHGSRVKIVGHAASAMRQVRHVGGDDFAVFDPAMAVDLKDQAELLRDLRLAVSKHQLELVYQPKIDARSMQITAAEALLRWHHPQRGLVSPAVFIPLAERFGLIGPIGNWVIDEACRQAGSWRRAGMRMRVAINISAYQMRQDDLVQRLQAALIANGLSPSRFTCEITESVAMEDTNVTRRSFERMRRAGLHVSIDDFGVGQASLSYLRRLPAAELKIDASFVADIVDSPDARAIVEAVINLAHALHLRVVAEGVETEPQRDILVRMGCDELQGFLFARPMSAKALSLWAMDDGDRPTDDFRASLFRDSVAPTCTVR